MPERDEPEVGHRGVGDEPHHVRLADRQQRAVDHRDDAEHGDVGREGLARVGEELQAVADHPEGADLVEDGRRGAPPSPGVDSRRGVGEPGVHGPHRSLDGERREEAEEQRLLDAVADRQVGQRPEVEGSGVSALARDDVEADEGGEHEQAAEEAVEQELDRGVLPLRSAEQADEEVDRDEHRFEEHVEQEEVERAEDADHRGLEDQQQREVDLDRAATSVDVVPRGEDARSGRALRTWRSAPARCRRRRRCSRCRSR